MAEKDPATLYKELAPRAPEGRFSLPALLPEEGPLELDIGFGRGLSLFERARVSPQSRVIGIEIKTKWAYKVQQRIAREGLSRLCVLCGDAREILSRAEPDACLDRVSVHFPDPWWKKRHGKRLVVQERLLDDLARLMRPGGELLIQTDVQERAEQYLEQLRAARAFALGTETGLVEQNPFGAHSNRERRAIRDGLPVWRILATRVQER
jgi:tRNA (guanine-N7-)-methyltransferase